MNYQELYGGAHSAHQSSHLTVAVTGANGFVGAALVSTLRDLGFVVRPCVRSERTAAINGEGIVTVAGLSSTTDWQQALEGVNVVVHAAARVHVLHEDAIDPLAEFRRTNVDGTLNLARQAAEAGVTRFVFISTVGVNGTRTNEHPFRADDTPAPESPYAQSKYEAEQGLKIIADKAGIEMVIIRPPLVYGPNAPGNFGLLMKWICSGLPLPLGAIKHNWRSLVALDNLVDLLVTCIAHPAAAHETFMVSDNEDISTADLLHRMGKAIGKPVRLVPVPEALLHLAARLIGKRDEVERLCGSLQVDISNTRRKLTWSPPMTVDESLRKVGESWVDSLRRETNT